MKLPLSVQNNLQFLCIISCVCQYLHNFLIFFKQKYISKKCAKSKYKMPGENSFEFKMLCTVYFCIKKRSSYTSNTIMLQQFFFKYMLLFLNYAFQLLFVLIKFIFSLKSQTCQIL